MKRIRSAGMWVCLAVTAFSCWGCSMRTLANRGGDFADIFEANGGVGVYTSNQLTPHLLVGVQATRFANLTLGNALTVRGGLYGGKAHVWTESAAALPVAPFAYYAQDESDPEDDGAEDFWKYDLFDRWDYLFFLPSCYHDLWTTDLSDIEVGATLESPLHWFDLSVDVVPLIPALRLGFSPGEFVDFLAGWVGLDPAADDRKSDEAVEAHLKRLLADSKNGSWRKRREALVEAYRYHPSAAAWEIMRSSCEWDDVRLRGMAFYLLTGAKWPRTDQAPILIRMMEDDDPRLRKLAIGWIHRMGPVAEVAVSALEVILDRPDRPDDRTLAADALEDIAMTANNPVLLERVVSALGRHLLDPEQRVRVSCQVTMQALGRRAVAAVPQLIELLQKGNAEERFMAVKVLGTIGSQAASAVPALENAKKNDERPSVRHVAEWALNRIVPK